MNYEPTAPAHHAATILWRNFVFEPRSSRVDATVGNIAIFIDYATQLPKVIGKFRQLYSGPKWTDASLLSNQLDRIRENVRDLEMVGEKQQTNDDGGTVSAEVSESAWFAARLLEQNFVITSRHRGPGERVVKVTLKNVALLIDVSADVQRLYKTVKRLSESTLGVPKQDLERNIRLLQRALWVAEIGYRHAPVKVNAGLDTKRHDDFEPPVTKEQRRLLMLVAERLRQAKTVSEEQQILKRGGITNAA